MADSKELQRISIADPETGLHAIVTVDRQTIELMSKLSEENPGMSSWDLHSLALRQKSQSEA